jgi:hypothetical protein
MNALTRVLAASCLLAPLLQVACGSGGGDGAGSSSGGSSSTSSSGGSSGIGSSSSGSSQPPPDNCNAICSTGAFLGFEESNAGGRLEGAMVETCLRDVCATGILAKRDGGAGYVLPLRPTVDAGGPPEIGADVLTPPGDVLRFRISWVFGYGETSGVADGDTYTVKARIGDGPLLFDESFVATYEEERVCGSVCKVFDVKP